MSDTIRKLLKHIHQKNDFELWIIGSMGKHEGSSVIFDVPGRPGYVFVTIRLASGAQTTPIARNEAGVAHSADMPVRMKDENQELVIYGKFTRPDIATVTPPPPSGVPTHLHNLADLNDVTITAAAAGDVLAHDGTDWVDAATIPVAMAATIHAATLDTTPLDADEVPGLDSSASFALLRWTWTSIKAFLKTYFDTLYNLYVHPNHTGDVTSVGDGATTIAANAVTYAKMQDIATDSLIGRDTAATGDPETISLGASLSMTGAQVLQRAALTGDVTAAANSNATTIANDAVTTAKILDSAVTYAKIQNVSATDKVLGRSTAGAGVVEEIALTAFARSLIDDIDAAAARTTLGLGTMAVEPEANYLLLAGRAGGQTVTGLSTGPGLKVLRNLTAASTDSPVVFIHQDHASDDQPALQIQQDANVSALDIVSTLIGVLKMRVINSSANAGAYSSYQLLNDISNIGAFFLLSSTNGGYAGANSFNMVQAGNYSLGFGTNDTIRMKILNDGTVRAHDGTAGWMFVSVTGVVGSEVEIVAAGAEDVAAGFVAMVVCEGSAGTTLVPTALVGIQTPAAASTDSTISALITFRLHSTGQLTVLRASGTETWSVAVSMLWQ